MKLKFKRIISNGNFIPEIDGLRFIAITSVVLYHLNTFLTRKYLNTNDIPYDFDILNQILSVGHLGVPLFFVISGFILAPPFASMYIHKNSKVHLKDYFLRRLTRLEPPYLLTMTTLLFGYVYIAKKISLHEGIISYLSSITYTHNFIYGKKVLPLLNGVAWSLEVEIQFYILMPFLAKLFLIKNTFKRRGFTIGLLLFFFFLNLLELLPFVSVINYMEYFLIGILLTDFYIYNTTLSKKTILNSTLSFFFLSSIWLLEINKPDTIIPQIAFKLFQLFSIFAFYYLVIIHRSVKLLSNRVITNIGGMCYSIYLLHSPLISLLGNPLINIKFSETPSINIIVYTFLLLLFVMLVSSSYFLLIERPCMNKNWFYNLKNKLPRFL